MLVVDSAPVDALPLSVFAPVHAPEAAQSVTLLLAQVSMALPPGEMLVGFTVNWRVGVGGGGGGA